jgi:O-antigen/teichoic acid export membrane protein
LKNKWLLLKKDFHQKINIQNWKYYKIWLIKIAFSIGDQGLVSGANFLLNILLARTISTDQYGAFSIGFSIFLFLSGFLNALIFEPMSVLAPKNPQWEIKNYLENLILWNFCLTGGFGIILLAANSIFPGLLGGDHSTLIGVAISTPFILLFWLLRRACYLESRSSLALQGSAIYCLTLLVGFYLLLSMNRISSFSVFILFGLSSTITSIYYWLRINHYHSLSQSKFTLMKNIIPAHWNYGKWVTGSAFVSWLSNLVLLPLIGMMIGLSQAGIFRAMQNTVTPLQQTLTAISLLFLPRLSARKYTFPSNDSKSVKLMVAGILSIALIYVGLICIFNRQVVMFLYNQKSDFLQYYWLIYFLGVYSMLDACGLGAGLILRASKKPQSIFFAQTGAAIVLISASLILIPNFLLKGAAIALVISSIISLVITMLFFRGYIKGGIY